MRKKLTERFIATLKPPASGRLVVTDADVRGLSIRVTPNGVKSWHIRYRPKGQKKQPSETPGTHPAMSLADARQRARDVLAAAKRGLDLPAQEQEQRREAAKATTVKVLLSDYVEKHCKLMQRQWRATERIFQMHVIPVIGDKLVTELRRADVVELLDDLQNKKGLRAQVNRVRAYLLGAFNWAVEGQRLEVNPVGAVKHRKQLEARRARVLSHDELRKVWRAADKIGGAGAAFVKLLMLLGQRRDEVRCMRRAEMVAGTSHWLIPAARNKGKRDHLVPLPPAAVEIIEALPRGGPYVLGTADAPPLPSHHRLKQSLERESGVAGWVLHDLRRTFSTELAALGVSADIRERLLNHAQPGLEQTYNVYAYIDENADALARWADRLAAIVSEGRDAPNVHELRKA